MTAEVVPMTAGMQVDREAILRTLNLNPRDPQTQALLLVCDRYGLDPLLKHMVLIQGRPYVTRDGYLHIAHQSGALDGIETIEEGDDGDHWWARVSVFRKDMSRPFTYKGRYPKSGGNKAYGPEMAIKCAEVAALRRAFNVTGIGAADEKWDDDAVAVPDEPVASAETLRTMIELLVTVGRYPDAYQAAGWPAKSALQRMLDGEERPLPATAAHAALEVLRAEIGVGEAGDREAPGPEPDATPPPGAPDGIADSPAPPEPSGYRAWSRDDLAAECEERGLPKSGTKDRLVDELEASDAVNGPRWATVPDARPW